MVVLCFQAEDCMRDLVRSRGLGDVYKRQAQEAPFVLLVGRDGRRTPVEQNITSIRDARGTVSGMVHVFRNRTEQQQVLSVFDSIAESLSLIHI